MGEPGSGSRKEALEARLRELNELSEEEVKKARSTALKIHEQMLFAGEPYSDSKREDLLSQFNNSVEILRKALFKEMAGKAFDPDVDAEELLKEPFEFRHGHPLDGARIEAYFLSATTGERKSTISLLNMFMNWRFFCGILRNTRSSPESQRAPRGDHELLLDFVAWLLFRIARGEDPASVLGLSQQGGDRHHLGRLFRDAQIHGYVSRAMPLLASAPRARTGRAEALRKASKRFGLDRRSLERALARFRKEGAKLSASNPDIVVAVDQGRLEAAKELGGSAFSLNVFPFPVGGPPTTK